MTVRFPGMPRGPQRLCWSMVCGLSRNMCRATGTSASAPLGRRSTLATKASPIRKLSTRGSPTTSARAVATRRAAVLRPPARRCQPAPQLVADLECLWQQGKLQRFPRPFATTLSETAMVVALCECAPIGLVRLVRGDRANTWRATASSQFRGALRSDLGLLRPMPRRLRSMFAQCSPTLGDVDQSCGA